MTDASGPAPEQTWRDIWQRRRVEPAGPSTLSQLMRADGFDAFGELTEDAWRAFVGRVAAALGLGPGASVFEVGCGSGAFLYPLHEAGCRVGGIDLSPALIETAGRAMPDGQFAVGDALAAAGYPACDAAVSCGVFLYFPSLDDATRVLDGMSAAASRAVAILDVPDRATEQAALAARRAVVGEEEYARRYRGLDHLYFDRAWFDGLLRARGFSSVRVEDQSLAGYTHAPFRFNVFATR